MYLMIYKKIGGVFGPVLAQFRSKLCGEIHWWCLQPPQVTLHQPYNDLNGVDMT